jgi:BirA family biotin operon repressor/biotin-[acetyl-CoA-carboxylase] ligase
MFLYQPETQSTMDDAAQCVAQGRVDVQGVLAANQTAGRGRNAHVWRTFGPPHGVAVTLILPMPGPHMALLVPMAVRQALVDKWEEGEHIRLKWPNDLMLAGRKMGGILIETVKAPDGNMKALVGIGLNLQRPEQVEEAFIGTFLCNRNIGFATPDDAMSLAAVLHTCIMQYIDLYNQHGWTAELNNRYSGLCTTLGCHIVWRTTQGGITTELTGLARGLTESGHLEMVADDGTVHIIHSGDILVPR